jgi:hypothetical protein
MKGDLSELRRGLFWVHGSRHCNVGSAVVSQRFEVGEDPRQSCCSRKARAHQFIGFPSSTQGGWSMPAISKVCGEGVMQPVCQPHQSAAHLSRDVRNAYIGCCSYTCQVRQLVPAFRSSLFVE